jgi:hypothetical protein
MIEGEQVGRVVTQVVEPDAFRVGFGLVVPEDDGRIDLAGAQHRDGLWWVGIDDLDPEARILRREDSRHFRQKRDEGRPVRRHAHPSGAQPDMCIQLCGRRIHAPENLGGTFGEDPAGLRQPDAAPSPLEQLRAGLRFQPGDVVAHRGLRVVQLAGRGGYRPVAGDRSEHPEPIEVEHSSTVSIGLHINKH